MGRGALLLLLLFIINRVFYKVKERERYLIFRHVGLLEIHNKKFRMTKLPLKTVRQFIFDEVILSDSKIAKHEDEKIFSYLTQKVFWEYFIRLWCVL